MLKIPLDLEQKPINILLYKYLWPIMIDGWKDSSRFQKSEPII